MPRAHHQRPHGGREVIGEWNTRTVECIRRRLWEIVESWQVMPRMLVCPPGLKFPLREATHDVGLDYMVCDPYSVSIQRESWRKLGVTIVPRLTGWMVGFVMQKDDDLHLLVVETPRPIDFKMRSPNDY